MSGAGIILDDEEERDGLIELSDYDARLGNFVQDEEEGVEGLDLGDFQGPDNDKLCSFKPSLGLVCSPSRLLSSALLAP